MIKDELMMHDWVYIKTPDGSDVMSQIDCITYDGISGTAFNLHDYFQSDIYSPIPLTAEILKLNGFEEQCYDGIRGMFHPQFRLFIRNFGIGFKEIRLSEENEENIICLRNVHNLQNFLRCVGYSDFANHFKVK